MEAIRSSETSVNARSTQRHIPETFFNKIWLQLSFSFTTARLAWEENCDDFHIEVFRGITTISDYLF
jgi:hypothetical protein